ncbi:MAG: ThuA domain-containing protein [Planctomycetota bacterium]|nr:ThuA domain-containing protein [Planctomycetota bacterium]
MMFRFGSLMGRLLLLLTTLWGTSSNQAIGQTDVQAANSWRFDLRFRAETKAESGRFHTLSRQENWDPSKTAVIICDVWDSHHSINAVRRVEEMAPRIDQFVKRARESGATIIHAPSECMESYVDHPARKRAVALPTSDNVPANMQQWCKQIDAEKRFEYPIDQSDGGEDDDLDEHAAWARELAANGRNPGSPWRMQTKLISIDDRHDFISDSGPEIWSLMESRDIDNVILCGVHTNMCVLGRPFGLRNMVTAGKRVVLVRDLTDTMYNPQRWPFVNHHTGTDLIVEYIEKCICPTITSDQLLSGQPFRFQSDTRPLLVMLVAEDEYETNQTLPKFAADFLGQNFRVEFVFGNEHNPSDLPGLEVLNSADIALVSVRRRPLPKEQLDIVRRFVDSGKPLLGIRTASHAFSQRTEQPPEGLLAWPEFDGQVLGGNYRGHHGNELLPRISISTEQDAHPILIGIGTEPFVSGGSLYITSPLAAKTRVLMSGAIDGKQAEPVAWTFERASGGRSFYTSLGHKEDFQNPAFQRLLFNALVWASGIEKADFVIPKKDKQQ